MLNSLRPDVRVIGFGGNAGVGKSTAARIAMEALSDIGVGYMPFALRLKEIAASAFGWDGQKDERGRRLLQVLGTEAGRAYNEDMWINAVANRINGEIEPYPLWIIDDCRFPNEVNWVNRHGVALRIHRLGTGLEGEAAAHASETLLDNCLWEGHVYNNADLSSLLTQIMDRLISNGIITKEKGLPWA